jgi:DNA-binding NarL/FixJ family response regulator
VDQVRVVVQATDPVTLAGLTRHLESHPQISLVEPAHRVAADVVVVATERLTAEVIVAMRRAAAESATPVVLIVNEINEAELLTAVECRVVAVLPRSAATGDRLKHCVLAAANGDGVLPTHLVGELIKHVERLQREVVTLSGLSESGLTPREIDVLRLMADGMDTAEIAEELCYSERTVKNVIHRITQRLNLRNRSHAVAYALRAGMI